MRSRLLASTGGLRTHVVVFEAGDDAVAGLGEFATGARLAGASFTAIGGFRRAVVGWFDVEARDYRPIEVEEQVEVLSLVGDVTTPGPESDSSERTVHVHAVLGRRDGSTVGGHLLEAIVRPTLEVVVSETPGHLQRRRDPATGLALIDLIDAEPPHHAHRAAHGGPSDDPNRS